MTLELEEYLNKQSFFQHEITKLREIILNCGLHEGFKWKHPCYSVNNKNILLIHEFKDYCAIFFFKGALLNDSENILIQQTKNTQAARQIRFTNISQIEKLKPIIEAYIFEAVEIENLGLEVKNKSASEFNRPHELELKFKENKDLQIAFDNLTPGRQKAYLIHFSQAKQAKTRVARIIKNTPRILKGKGLNDCVCGLSKRMPNCDGSHRLLDKKDIL